MLSIDSICVSFGGVLAVDNVSFDVEESRIVGLIGANGAGKSTLVNATTGYVPIDAGEVLLEGRSLNGLAPHRIARYGLSRTFQQAKLWGGLSVYDNISLAISRMRSATVSKRVHEVSELLGIENILGQSSAILPYGTRRLVEVARALAVNPRVLVLDEPAAGLSLPERGTLLRSLRTAVSERKMGILLIDHDIRLVVDACDYIVALDAGSVIADGLPQEVVRDSRVLASYLGTTN